MGRGRIFYFICFNLDLNSHIWLIAITLKHLREIYKIGVFLRVRKEKRTPETLIWLGMEKKVTGDMGHGKRPDRLDRDHPLS